MTTSARSVIFPASATSPPRRARAVARLAAFVSIAAASNAAGAAARRIGADSPACALARGGRLARRLIDALGVRAEVLGSVPPGQLVLVANHRSYVDVPILAAGAPSVFLAKAEIAAWPVVGTASRLAHRVFVERESRESRESTLRALGVAPPRRARGRLPGGDDGARPGDRRVPAGSLPARRRARRAGRAGGDRVWRPQRRMDR